MPLPRDFIQLRTPKSDTPREASAKIKRQVNRAMRELGVKVEPIYKRVAPRKTGRLRRRIRSRASFRGNSVTVSVSANARSKGGFNYVNVTRHGHRKKIIYPKRAQALRFQPAVGRRAISRAHVKGYSPTHDWVQDADAAVIREVGNTTRKIGRSMGTIKVGI